MIGIAFVATITSGISQNLFDKNPSSRKNAYWILCITLAVAALICSFNIAFTNHIVAKESVTWNWLYWVSAVFWTLMHMNCMTQAEKLKARTPEQLQKVHEGAGLLMFVGIVILIILVFIPSLNKAIFGWMHTLLGIEMG